MLHALLIFDPSKFPIFEFYTDKSVANQIMDFADKNDELDKVINDIEGRCYFMTNILNKFNIVVIYSEEKLEDHIRQNLETIGEKVIMGDKVTLKQVLDAKMLANFEFVI